MDDLIRNLERLAAAGGPAEREALAQALKRLGRASLSYTGPQPVPTRGYRAPRQVDRAEASTATWWDCWGQPSTRRQAAARAVSKRRRRRAVRRVRKAISRDWDRWD